MHNKKTISFNGGKVKLFTGNGGKEKTELKTNYFKHFKLVKYRKNRQFCLCEFSPSRFSLLLQFENTLWTANRHYYAQKTFFP